MVNLPFTLMITLKLSLLKFRTILCFLCNAHIDILLLYFVTRGLLHYVSIEILVTCKQGLINVILPGMFMLSLLQNYPY